MTAENNGVVIPTHHPFSVLISSDVELKEVPTTGEEYLLKVITERRNTPEIFCNIERSRPTWSTTPIVLEEPLPKAHENLKPSLDWQNIQVANFKQLKLYISRIIHKKPPWPQIQRKYIRRTARDWQKFFDSNEPTLTCILGIDYKIYEFGIEHLINTLDEVKHGDTIPKKTGQFIYALLACFYEPVLRDSVWVLRSLARKCSEIRSAFCPFHEIFFSPWPKSKIFHIQTLADIRSIYLKQRSAHIDPENENAIELATPLNLFICLVSRHYSQLDLAD